MDKHLNGFQIVFTLIALCYDTVEIKPGVDELAAHVCGKKNKTAINVSRQ